MIRLIYNLLWPVGLLLFLPGYLVKMVRRGGYREKFGQRLGIYDRDLRTQLGRQASIWLHAVSVGEVAIALKLAEAIKTLELDARFVLTTTTTTGFAFARKNASPWVEVMYSPLDFWPVMRCAFSVIRPAKIVLTEAEVWPNLVAEASARRIPLALVNARLSPRSEQRFCRFRWLVAPTFRLLDLVCVQEAVDTERWAALGVRRDRICHTGSIKYDPTGIDERMEIQRIGMFHLNALNPDHLVLLGGSTHRGEEELLARAFIKLRNQFPALTLVIAPRHVERVKQIQKQLQSLALNVLLKSQAASHPNSRPDCILLDSTGELSLWYGIATVVFIGKSLTARGGQNPVEAIVARQPVIFGPHMENFATLAHQLVTNDGAIQVRDADSLELAIAKLLRQPEDRRRLLQNAVRVLDSHRGATMRTAKLVLDLK